MQNVWRLIRDWLWPARLPPVDDAPPAGAVPFALKSERCLSREQMLRVAGRRGLRSGKIYWWLRSRSEDCFVRHVDLPRGDATVDREVLLLPGRYTLGVGSGADAIRVNFSVPATEERKCGT